VGGVAAFVGLGAVSRVEGAEQADPIRLSYHAPAGCPSAQEFESAVRERLRRARVAAAQEIAREYRVTIWNEGARSLARLEFVATNGSSIVRELRAPQCAEAARAIALVTALAAEAVVPTASGEAPNNPQAPVPPIPSADPPAVGTQSSVAPQPAPSSALPQSAGAKPVARRAQRPPPEQMRAPKTPAEPLTVPVGARATVTSPKGPDPILGIEVFGAIAGSAPDWLLQLGIAGERGLRVGGGPGDARFNFVGGRLEACVFSVQLARHVSAMPCGLLEGGALIAQGFIDEPETAVDPWFAVAPTGRVAWNAGRGWSLLFEAGPLFSLTYKNRYVFGDVSDPEAIVHDVPLLGAFFAAGVAWEGLVIHFRDSGD
jgi:hypothetical protein